MKKYYLFSLMFLCLFLGCGDDSVDDEISPLLFTNDPRLDQDSNGYYHLTIDTISWQTIHRLSGTVTRDGQPVDLIKFYWESNLYWILGDTLGYIVHQGLTDDYVYVSYDTTYITGFTGFEVPTINSASYSNSDGEVN